MIRLLLVFSLAILGSTQAQNIDVINYQLNLNITNLSSKSIQGNAAIKFKSNANTNTVTFDLLKLKVDSVTANVPVSFSQNDSQLILTYQQPIAGSDTQNIVVYYNGKPVSDSQWGGFYFSGDYAFNMGVAFASVPHNFGRCWFPCIDNFTDRATYYFNITTDSGYVAMCNGLLQKTQVNANGTYTYEWKLEETIPTYLANVAVGKYKMFESSYKNIPVIIAALAADSVKVAQSFIHLNEAMSCFEEKFGPYPFSRIGYVAVPFNAGAMEHATNISYPIYAVDGSLNYETLMAHELSHMWWGNMVTCETAEDMWLNEGWASFCEAEFLSCLYGNASAAEEIWGNLIEVYRSARSRDGAYLPVSGIGSNNTYGTHVYKKGSLVAHNLKQLMGSTQFYAACKSYLLKYKFKAANSINLRDEFQKFTTADLTAFFDAQVFNKGHHNVVFEKFSVTEKDNQIMLNLALSEQVRLTEKYLKNFPAVVQLFTSTDTLSYTITLKNGYVDTTLTLPINTNILSAAINHKSGMALAKSTEIRTIKNTGITSFNNALLTVTTKSISDSVIVLVEHNFTGPFFWQVEPKGIRISGERYWRVDGNFGSGYDATAFFNYDGSTGNNGFLDTELFNANANEDSLVLLYRANPNSKWQLHTDHVFQPGPSKTDFIGRFWVNKLNKGEYAFGIKDISAGLKKNKINDQLFKLFPNPTNDLLNIVLNQGSFALYRIYTIGGQLSLSGQVTTEKHLIHTDNLPKGIYVIYLEQGERSGYTRFIKE